MTGEEKAQAPLSGPGEIPMETSPKPKKPGSDLLGFLYIIVGLFVLIAAFQLYFTIQDLIRAWVSDQYVPLASAVYYCLVMGIGIWLIRDYIRHQ